MQKVDRKGGGLNKLTRYILYILAVGALFTAIAGYFAWDRVLRPNVNTGEEHTADLYIPTGSNLEDVLDILDQNRYLRDRSTFEWTALRKNYHNNIRPGRYRLTNGMNNNELVNLLRSGNQMPVNVVFISHRRLEEIASVVSGQIEADSAEIADLVNNDDFIDEIGYTRETIPALFIPNTYEMYWNTSARQFVNRMRSEYERFWNGSRDDKRGEIGLTRVEVSTLASIISEETAMVDEMPVIAGVYLNRLKRGMRLQADPTVKFALGDVTVNRILTVHLSIDSPYNTYKYAGLPPGPISVPPVQAIDAVLNAEDHDYYYFSAREDFSGYHRFARTLSEHNRNARLYQNVLNQRRIFR
jgi:UPF0755 protein